MTDPKATARELLNEWNRYKVAKPRNHALDIQYEKDQLSRWAETLRGNMLWSTDLTEITENCYQFQTRLSRFKDNIIIELLTNGSA
jgi:hypothetical protein